MAQFVACRTTNDASHIVNLYFKEIMQLRGIPRSVVLDWVT